MPNDEGLDDSVLNFLGNLVYAWPIYGWGWAGVSDDPFEVPEPFHIRITAYWDMPPGKRRGGIGLIEEPGHRYEGYWTVFSTRHVGLFNFTTAIDHFNISMASYEPVLNQGWPTFGGIPRPSHPSGYCQIADTKERWDKYHAQVLADFDRRRKELEEKNRGGN